MRLPDWDRRLVEAMASHIVHPFAWGTFDCARLMADAVRAVVGFDPLDGFAWSSAIEARRALRRVDADCVGDYISRLFPEIDPSEARRGDLATPNSGIFDPLSSPAVVLGSDMVSRNAERFVVLPTSIAVRAWRVA